METRIVRISVDEIDKDLYLLRKPANSLKMGDVVAFPTETVYGLGANATMSEAVKKIFELKGRPYDNPLIVHLHSKDEVYKYASVSNEVEEKILDTFTPGPITVVLKKKEVISAISTAGLDTVGIRIPYNPIARKLIELSEVPVAAPSANISGKPSATDPNTVIEEFSGKIPYIVDGGRTHIGIESTVVKVEEAPEKFTILIVRPGFVTKEDLEEFVTSAQFKKPVEVLYVDERDVDKPISPGQKYKHYSPKCHVVLVNDINKVYEVVKEYKNGKIGLLGRPKFLSKLRKLLEYWGIKDIVELEWCKNDIIDCARNLFFAYRIFDKENTILILVERLEEKGIGYSIMNRVRKSATYIV
ncbi:MAG: L-threonylcarbamoyladenylate synthase [Brevinematales bacterium]|nr:L-threonylcarbamoyladenylate synthase [Brevinematales bacterium]